MLKKNNMKILLIMPNFFNYPEVICDELKNMGHEVDFFDDRPSCHPFVKAAVRFNRNLITPYINKYFSSIKQKIISKTYDVFLLISGQSLSLSESMIIELRNILLNTKFVLYQWDSQKNFSYIKRMHKYFDVCYSFDKCDVKNNSCLKFLPLFYSRMYEEIGNNTAKEYKYNFCFVGTAHPKKYKFISKISKELKNVYSKQFIYFFFPSRLVYLYRKLFNKDLRKAKYSEFHFRPLNSQEMKELYELSECILDSAQSGQLGLTMRVIEALGAKKKIITTNEDVKNYDFYNPENIYIYKDKIDQNDVFFGSVYKPVSDCVYKKYSLRNWLQVILE